MVSNLKILSKMVQITKLQMNDVLMTLFRLCCKANLSTFNNKDCVKTKRAFSKGYYNLSRGFLKTYQPHRYKRRSIFTVDTFFKAIKRRRPLKIFTEQWKQMGQNLPELNTSLTSFGCHCWSSCQSRFSRRYFAIRQSHC